MKHLRFGLAAVLAAALPFLISACGQQQEPVDKAATSAAAEPVELVVYSARKEHLIKPLFDRFTEQTGIKVSYVTDDAGALLARLSAEGEGSPADMLMTVDAGNLWHAASTGVLQPVQSELLSANVPAHLRDPDGLWYALTIRARTLVYSTERVKPTELTSYEALADESWKGRLCLRTSKKVYNQSLVATMIAALGEAEAETVIQGWVANLALPPLSNDTKVMEAIAAGQCDVGIVNTYYYGRLMKDQPELALGLFWPNQSGEGAEGRGVHVNISGAGVTRSSRHPQQAQQLIEFLTQPEQQQILMDMNQEYAVNGSVAMNAELSAWGAFKSDNVNVSTAGQLQADAVKLMDRAGYQ